jgi:hypothetical protein
VKRKVTVPVGGLATTTSMYSLLPFRGNYSSGAVAGPVKNRRTKALFSSAPMEPPPSTRLFSKKQASLPQNHRIGRDYLEHPPD